VCNTVDENSSIFCYPDVSLFHQEGHVDSKTLYNYKRTMVSKAESEHNRQVFNWVCQLMQVDQYNGHRPLVIIIYCWAFNYGLLW